MKFILKFTVKYYANYEKMTLITAKCYQNYEKMTLITAKCYENYGIMYITLYCVNYVLSKLKKKPWNCSVPRKNESTKSNFEMRFRGTNLN